MKRRSRVCVRVVVGATEPMSKESAHASPVFLNGVFHRALDALEEVCVVIGTGRR